MKTSVGIRQLEKAVDIDRLYRQSRYVQRLVRKTQDGTIGTAEDNEMSEDDASFNVGDQVHNHYHGPPQQSSALKKLAPAIALGSALALGGGAGVAIPLIASWMSQQKVEAPTMEDTDTRRILRSLE